MVGKAVVTHYHGDKIAGYRLRGLLQEIRYRGVPTRERQRSRKGRGNLKKNPGCLKGVGYEMHGKGKKSSCKGKKLENKKN